MKLKELENAIDNFMNMLVRYKLSVIPADKQIVAFGAGKNFYALMQFPEFAARVRCVLDNRKELQGTFVQGKRVVAPEAIKGLENDNFLIVITVSAFQEVCDELNREYAITENIDFVTCSSIIETQIRLNAYKERIMHLWRFFENIPSDYFNVEKRYDRKDKIAVVIGLGFIRFAYPVALFLILVRRGYDVDLVIDDSFKIPHLQHHQGLMESGVVIADNFRKFVFEMQKRHPQLTVRYVNDVGVRDNGHAITDEDECWIRKNASDDALWVRGMNNVAAQSFCDEGIENICVESYRFYLSRLKSYFSYSDYDALVTFSDPEIFAPCLVRVAEALGVRVATFENVREERMIYSSSGLAVHFNDIASALKGGAVHADVLHKLYIKAQEAFDKYRNSIVNLEKLTDNSVPYIDVSLQPARSLTNETYDIVIPLNVIFDGAALHHDGCFSSQMEWLLETIDFIINKTDANVVVRPHPVARYLRKSISYKDELNKNFGHTDRFRYVDTHEDVNTYQLLENAKLVLPWSNTVGLEAVLMKIPVIMVIDTYYSAFPFVNLAESRSEYFKLIKQALAGELQNTGDITDAFLCWYMVKKYSTEAVMVENYGCVNMENGFLAKSIIELEKSITTDKAIRVLADGIPAPCVFADDWLNE